MPKLWKKLKSSSKNNDRSGSTELKRHDSKNKKSVVSNEKDIPKDDDLSSSLIQNRLVLQEFVELQNGIVNEVAFLINEKPKDVIMKVDLLGVHVYDKENPKQLIKEFEVEQIIQYSYERDKQYLTLSYMNSEFSVESYDFITPDYFEIFDFIGHVIAMVIKMNNQKYEAEEENNDDSSFQLPRISTMYKSSDSTNIFSPTFILNNFMPESNQNLNNYLNDDQNEYNSSTFSPESDEKVVNQDRMTLNNEKDDKDSDDSNINNTGLKDKTNYNVKETTNVDNLNSDISTSTPNLFVSTNSIDDNNRSSLMSCPKSALEMFPLDKTNKENNSNKNLYRKSDYIESFDHLDKRSSTQYRTIRHHMSSGKFDASEIPAYGKKYGTIHYRKSRDFEDIYTSDFVLNSIDGHEDKNHQEISNHTQAKVNLMKYFVENRYNIDKKKAYSICTLIDDNGNNNENDDKQQNKKKEDSDDELSVNIESSKDTIETTRDEEKEKKKNKYKLHISKTNINKACEEVSPSIELLDESESPTKKSSKMSKMKYSFTRPKSLQLNFLTYKDSSKKRISIKNANDLNDIYTPSPIDNDFSCDNEKSKSQKRKSNIRKSKLVPSKKEEKIENFENDEYTKNENELIGVISDDNNNSNNNKNIKPNNIQYYNPITDEIEEKPINENIRTSMFNIPKCSSESSDIQDQNKNESDLLSAYLEAYSSSPGSKVYSTAVSTIKSQNDFRLSSTYPKEFINSINDSMLSPVTNESNYEYFMNETDWNNSKNDLHSNKKKSKSAFVESPILDKNNSNLRTLNNIYKSEDVINLDLNIIKEQYKDTVSKSSDCLNDRNEKIISQNNGQQVILINNQHQQLHKYKSKQIMNYRTIHGVSPFVSQSSSNALSSTSPSSDKNSNKVKSSHGDIYSTFRKFVGKNQKPKASISDIFDSSPDNNENKLPQIEKEYENGKEYLIRTLKDNHYEVTAGTVHALIDEMILNNTTDIMFIDIFLLTYRHFLKSNDFVMLLTDEFNKLVEKANDIDNNSSLQIQKIASVIKKWVAEYFNDFLMSSEALKNLNLLIDSMKNSDKAQCQSYIDQINSLIKYGLKQSEEESDDEAKANKLNNDNISSEIDLIDILNISSKKVAQQITLADSKIWRSIESPEYAHFLWDGKDVKEKNTKNIQKFIERFNQISFWVSTMICTTEALKTRSNVLEKMIKIAKYCLEIQNFNATMAILSGLNMAAVSRLKGTWMNLSTKTMNTYTEIEEIMSYKCNFKNYRELEYNAKPPFIPFFGLLLKDLTFMNDGNQKILKNELINFQKLRIIYSKIKSYNLIQKNLYNFQPDTSIIEISNNDNTSKHEIEMFEYFTILPHYKEMTLLEFSRKIENSKSYNVVVPKTQSKTNKDNLNENENPNSIKNEKLNNTTKNTNLVDLFQQ
ncbi:ras GEF [Piromyces finnis]|uniref:Ras GEF n=1 Tax=Piromyces finnis TaxID=1754191 RepID=A0A1Y1VMS3_9FUNG|nr:ras GEF [Piromyces finnis]|eukprot:ORX60217.1 ras GEF [Piromyces finnis]